ncbi:MAG TPA: hypothetical protein VNY05_08355 [Candidatus Acidoferrales bacterium]|jgi:hypothetical protein|nr:hypothetical protein [Candidatus Acidoferrales bacterium]
MTSTTQDELFKTFVAVSGKQASNLDEMASSLAGVVTQVNNVQSVQPVRPVQPVPSEASASTPATTGGSVGSTVESIATSVLTSGLGVVPLVSELLGLFGGGSSPAPPPLVKYAMPAKLSFEGADTQSGLSNSDYDQSGMPRAYAAAPATGNGTTSNGSANGSSTGQSSRGGAAPQITVNVQAMDARSFLDRSTDIAAAVRDAMLNLSSINDVVNDL